jgi:hypothetical protein
MGALPCALSVPRVQPGGRRSGPPSNEPAWPGMDRALTATAAASTR